MAIKFTIYQKEEKNMVNLRKGVNLKKVSKQKYTFTCTISKSKLVKNK